MADDISVPVDLFGDPIPATRDKAGRPEHARTPENSNKVSLLFACGYKPKDAALALGITMPTFRKHYFPELERYKAARLRMVAKQLGHLNAEAEAGNVSAIKEILKRLDNVRLAELSDAVAATPAARSRQPAKGKKEAMRDAAGDVTGKFAPPPPPPLIH